VHDAGRSEGGFTIVEVLVAALVLTLGAMATFGLLGTATKGTQQAKAAQVALNLAQQELEIMRGLSYEEVALTATPEQLTNRLNPSFRVNGALATFAVIREPPSDYRKLVVNGGTIFGAEKDEKIKGGIVDPGPTPFTSGDVTGEVYRYVVWSDDVRCGVACPGTQDIKRVIVAVKLDTPGNQGGERGYAEVQSDIVDPTDSAENDPIPNSDGEIVTAQQFYLSDTPCSPTGTTDRQAILGDHLLHNTLGTCADGPKTGPGEPGAPDALLLGGPPDPAPADPAIPPLYDYSDDTHLDPMQPMPETDKGLQIRRDDTPDCHYEPTGTVNPESQIHRWVTDPFAADFVLTDSVTLEFYTRTLSDEPHDGQLCVFLFLAHAAPVPDTLLANSNGGTTYWTYAPTSWQVDDWEPAVRLEMDLAEAPYTIPAGERLGVALSIERANTPAEAIPIMYDHPKYQTRLEVDTGTPIDGG
jgi:type II secretory pathway pseudopilin PulG